MFSGDKLIAHIIGNLGRGIKNLNQLRREINIKRSRDGAGRFVAIQTLNRIIGEHHRINLNFIKNRDKNTFVLQQQSHQKVNRTNLILTTLNRQLVSLANHLFCFRSKVRKWRRHKLSVYLLIKSLIARETTAEPGTTLRPIILPLVLKTGPPRLLWLTALVLINTTSDEVAEVTREETMPPHQMLYLLRLTPLTK